jgi:hypothetical protein
MNDHIEIATCWHHCVEGIRQEMEANARLIAAAPETKRQRDAALVVIRRLLAFPGNTVVETEARALLAECEAGDVG